MTIENFSKNFIPAQKKRLESFSAYSQNFGSFEAEFLIKMFLIKKDASFFIGRDKITYKIDY